VPISQTAGLNRVQQKNFLLTRPPTLVDRLQNGLKDDKRMRANVRLRFGTDREAAKA
jgi:hypothetical protein